MQNSHAAEHLAATVLLLAGAALFTLALVQRDFSLGLWAGCAGFGAFRLLDPRSL